MDGVRTVASEEMKAKETDRKFMAGDSQAHSG